MSLTSQIFKSVDSIPDFYWERLDCRNNIYFTPKFLKAFEKANTDIEFNYVFVLKDTEPVGFANTQIVSIGVKTITKNIRMWSWLRGAINSMLCNTNLRVLFCGNVFLSGEYGTLIKKDEHKKETFKGVAQGLKILIKQTKKLHTIFVKDFEDESLDITNMLEDYDFASMHVEPNMIIRLKAEWHSFEDYKLALKSKYRVKANKADSKSAELHARNFTEEDIINHQKQLQSLYQNTIDNANFNAQILNLETYIYLKNTFKDRFIVRGYFLQNELVGFLSAMKNGNSLDAHFIGIDYSKNKLYAIYPRILNDYVRLGIENKVETINLGRTASEIKSTLGAEPVTLTCYCKHKRVIPNKLLKPFVKNVQIKTFKQHKPFK